MPLSKDLVAASSRPIVLSILARGDNYGYEILQHVKLVSRGELAWTEGMLYPVLHRLEREGLIKAIWRTSDAGRRRKYYRLLRSGRRALERERREWMAVHETMERLWRDASCPS